MKINKQTGFTLIELLVVVAIIGILASVVLASLNSARVKARDAKRMSDIQQIRNAIEMYITANGHAPDLGDSDCLTNATACYAADTMSEWDTLAQQLSPFISSLPKDPCWGGNCRVPSNDGLRYSYYYAAPGALYYDGAPYTVTSTSYSIYAEALEGKENSNFGFGLGSI